MNNSNREVIREACSIIENQMNKKSPDIRCVKEQANLILKYAIKVDEQLNGLIGIKQ